jgi:hypothetical protein
MSRHHLRRSPRDRWRHYRLDVLMAAVTALLIGAGVYAITHPDLGGHPGCTPIPGTSRLDCGE